MEKRGRNLMWERGIRKWHWRVIRWGTCTCMEWLRVKLCNHVFFFLISVSFLVFAHGSGLISWTTELPYTSHLCLNCVAQFSAFLKDQKKWNSVSSMAVCGNVPICEVCFTAEIFQSDKSHSLFRKKVEQWAFSPKTLYRYKSIWHQIQRMISNICQAQLTWNAPITAIWHCAMSKHFYYIILDQCFSKCDK